MIKKIGLPISIKAYVIVEQPLPPRVMSRKADRPTFRSYLAEPNDPALARLPIAPETIKFRFDQGAECMILMTNDEVAGCLWFTFNPFIEDEVRCKFTPAPEAEACWDFDLFIHPQFRFTRAMNDLWADAALEMESRGARRTFSRISVFNLRSLRSHQRLGAAPVARIDFFYCWGAQLMIGDVKPWIHFGWKNDDFPHLLIVSSAHSEAGRNAGRPS